MPSPIYRYEGAEFLGTTPEAAAVVGAFVSPTGSRSIVVTQTTELFEQDTMDVPVVSARALVPGDLLRIAGLDYPEHQLHVSAVNSSRTVLTLQNYGAYVQLAQGAELFVAVDAPVMYRDATLAHPYDGALPRTDSAGRWEFYSTAPVMDLFFTGGGLGADLRDSARAGFRLTGAITLLDVRDYPSIQAAIDALPAMGGTVFIPAGEWYLADTLYTPCDRPCHLLGEGANHEGDKGTVLVWTGQTGMLRVRGNDSSVRNMVLRNDSGWTASEEHEGYGIHIGRRDVADAHPHPGTSTTATEYAKGGRHPLRTVHVEDVVVIGAPGWGLTIPGVGYIQTEAPEYGRVKQSATEEGTLSFWIHVIRTKIIGSQGFGGIFVGTGCTTTYFSDGATLAHGIGQSSVPAFYAYIRGVTHHCFHRWTFEGTSPAGNSGGTSRPWVKFVGCESVVLDTVYFENDMHISNQHPAPGAQYDAQYFLALSVRNRSVSMRNVFFARHGVSGGMLRCIYCEKDGVKGLQIEQPCAFSSTALSQDFGGQQRPLDREAIVLNGETGGTQDNEHIVLAGAGVARDSQQTGGGALEFPPLTYAQVPLTTHVLGTRGLVVPRSTPELRADNTLDNRVMLAREGALVVEALTDDPSGPHALVYSTGPESGWRHIANVPTLTDTQRGQWSGWQQGDMVIDPSVPKLVMFVEGHWQDVKTFPL